MSRIQAFGFTVDLKDVKSVGDLTGEIGGTYQFDLTFKHPGNPLTVSLGKWTSPDAYYRLVSFFYGA